MLLELMSNGTLAELPPENMPDGIFLPPSPPGDSSVMVLLPHNKYLLGQRGGEWIYAGTSPTSPVQNVFLYDSQSLALANENAAPTILNAGTVNTLRRELLAVSSPPGNHKGAVLMLRTFMRNFYPSVFMSDSAEYLDEKKFSLTLRDNPILRKAYWTIRFALTRGELETITRLKAWLKADPENFTKHGHDMRLWFSLQCIPPAETISELESLSFSQLEIRHMAAQTASHVVMYNQNSGWLVMARFGRVKDTMFFLWAYFNHDLWNVLRERKKLTVNDIILASWGEHDTRQAMKERAKYKGDDDLTA